MAMRAKTASTPMVARAIWVALIVAPYRDKSQIYGGIIFRTLSRVKPYLGSHQPEKYGYDIVTQPWAVDLDGAGPDLEQGNSCSPHRAENFISKLLTYRRTSPTWFKETFHKIKPPSNIEGG
jgi:hypothetical protein